MIDFGTPEKSSAVAKILVTLCLLCAYLEPFSRWTSW